MTDLDILAPTLGRPGDETALLCAARLALGLNGRVAALYALPDPADAFVWAGEGLTAPPSAEAIEAARELQEDADRRIQVMIKSVQDAVPLPGGVPCLTRTDSTARAVIEFSALFDLIVFPADVAKSGGPLGGAFEAALLRARAPVLLAREADILGKPAFIAWDGGLEAGRAVRSALPILRKASSVTVCQAASEVGDRARAGVDPNLLQARLQSAGITTQVTLIDASSSANAAEQILAVAGAGSLLVSGAYAHSRAQEMIFGGATRTFLSSKGPSLFLSH
jgi:nucleotide-binding universal stress UspA family protein